MHSVAAIARVDPIQNGFHTKITKAQRGPGSACSRPVRKGCHAGAARSLRAFLIFAKKSACGRGSAEVLQLIAVSRLRMSATSRPPCRRHRRDGRGAL